MVKLQKRFAYKYKDKEHYKHIVVIPEEAIEELGWKGGDELEVSVDEKELMLSKRKKSEKR